MWSSIIFCYRAAETKHENWQVTSSFENKRKNARHRHVSALPRWAASSGWPTHRHGISGFSRRPCRSRAGLTASIADTHHRNDIAPPHVGGSIRVCQSRLNTPARSQCTTYMRKTQKKCVMQERARPSCSCCRARTRIECSEAPRYRRGHSLHASVYEK